VAGGIQTLAAIAQHDAPKTAVGHDEIRAAADYDGGQAARARGIERGDERLGAAGLDEDIGFATDAEARVAGERHARGNSYIRESGEAGARLFRGGHSISIIKGATG
jgi:hypothetical protein